MIEYNGKIDTIKMAGSVRLTKGGGALFSRATSRAFISSAMERNDRCIHT